MNDLYLSQLKNALNSLTAIPDQELQRLFSLTKAVSIAKNDFFAKAGAVQPCLGFIISGIFRCYYINDQGAEYTKHFFGANDFMAANSRSFFDQESEYFFEALEEATVLMIEVRKAGPEFLNHPCWREVSHKSIERIHHIEERRIRHLMLDDAQLRYLNFREDFPGMENRIKQAHIASYLGISPVSLSRIRAKLKTN